MLLFPARPASCTPRTSSDISFIVSAEYCSKERRVVCRRRTRLNRNEISVVGTKTTSDDRVPTIKRVATEMTERPLSLPNW